MRWIWIDKFTAFEKGTRAVAVKLVSAAEEHVHDLTPHYALHPHSLIVEGMAQTAGILIGHANDYKLKVILAKVGRATFHRVAKPGDVLEFTATIQTLNDTGASTEGTVTVNGKPLADINLMFSHIDNNLGGQQFPENNFVFDESNFADLLRDVDRLTEITI